MFEIKTYAMHITEDNYSLALAFLPPSVTCQPPKNFIGCFLVVNDRVVLETKEFGLTVAITNVWLTLEDFRGRYECEGLILDGKLHEVYRI